MTLKNRGAKSKMKTYGMGVGIKQINYDLNNQLYLLTCIKITILHEIGTKTQILK